MTSKELREKILGLTGEFWAQSFPVENFIPGETRIPVSGKVFDSDELRTLVDCSLDFWLTSGRFARRFEKEFSRWIGIRECSLTNSGSSANLLAISSLTSSKIGERRLVIGDEVITLAAGFPTTVGPIIQNGLVPVFVDISLPTYNVDCRVLENAISSKTKAVMIAHTLGNPFDLEKVQNFVDQHNLWLIADNCDSLGSLYNGINVASQGDLVTTSFYPAHHITMGEGGAVLTNDPKLKTIVESFRDWGRDCWCEPGKDNTCGKRFDWDGMGELPCGYDHKYTYSHLGYNLKITDMQAAVGVAQLKKLDRFIKVRKRNFQSLFNGLKDLEEFFILPEATKNSDPSWFGFPLSIRGERFSRRWLIQELEERKISTRLIFGGNLTKQPGFQGRDSRIGSSLEKTNFVMNQSFWIGVFPGISQEMIEYVVEVFHDLIKKVKRGEK